ncbi:carbohydrate ABC transporter permease [Cohnella zeiphila]|uniref:Sugar ABC transporter permease n=1 Tax=Cohnella zeiphila TaxID=2761120 RepID=A0A7X0VWI7_9BACL|nr:sugar ABC transporter permease [Cohnella zeiphila]MBB6732442.1 sugar ABC transporter permease [Cohnella zeiphila]
MRGTEPRLPLWRSVYRAKHAYAFLLPLIALLAIFSYYPIVMALKMSFYQWKGGNEAIFNGLDNFRELFSDPTFYRSLGNVFRFILFDCTVGVLMPLLVAELLFHLRSARLQYAFRTMFVATITVPSVVVILIWVFLYNPVVGGMNAVVSVLGIGPQLWLGGTSTALGSVILSGFPFINPIYLLIIFAGLQAIPGSLIEASVLEGCGRWRRFLSIDLPLVSGQLKLVFILSVLHAMQSFYKPLIMTGGGPGDATLVPGLYMFQSGFSRNDFGYASTIGFVMLIAMLAITFATNKLVRSEND